MSTTIRYERNAMMSAATLTDEDGGTGYVFCALPGGRPWFSLTWNGAAVQITNAPQCDTHAEFRRFVAERFGR
jgi:hypothetical protein